MIWNTLISILHLLKNSKFHKFLQSFQRSSLRWIGQGMALIIKGSLSSLTCNSTSWCLYVPTPTKTKKTYQINTHVTCISENVIYRITCKKPQCKDFVYIGQTKMRFCDRFAEHRGYVSQNKLDQVCGEHFTKYGHSQEDMLPIIIEQDNPKNDDFLRLKREELWIRAYQCFEKLIEGVN